MTREFEKFTIPTLFLPAKYCICKRMYLIK